MSRPRIKQAVVVIHGVGEQRPMDTLKKFVGAILGRERRGVPNYVCLADRLSRLLEMRTLQERRLNTRTKTHFFEYYWAHKMVGTTFRHVREWAFSVLLRKWRYVPEHLRPLWLTAWICILIGVLAVAGGLTAHLTDFISGVLPAGVSVAGVALIAATLRLIVLGVVGDAARYLSPHPKNIAVRQSVRADGLELLRKLHERGDYDRIIVVGHSLGSVVAYDILQYLWGEYHGRYNAPREHAQPALKAAEDASYSLTTSPSEEARDRYRKAQVALWWELRELGSPWLVTDLITAGSPLAHAALLLARNESDLRAKLERREFQANPPFPDMNFFVDDREWLFSFDNEYTCEDGTEVTLRAPHDGALFSFTRWTNLYFPIEKWLLGGDPLGGPIERCFGRGIKDIPVTDHRRMVRRTPIAHVRYWDPGGRSEGVDAEDISYSIPAIVNALDLDCRNTFPEDDASAEELVDMRQVAKA